MPPHQRTNNTGSACQVDIECSKEKARWCGLGVWGSLVVREGVGLVVVVGQFCASAIVLGAYAGSANVVETAAHSLVVISALAQVASRLPAPIACTMSVGGDVGSVLLQTSGAHQVVLAAERIRLALHARHDRRITVLVAHRPSWE